MLSEQLQTDDAINSSELELDSTELPEAILQVVNETIANNNSKCLDPINSRGRCLQMSHELMHNLAAIGKIPFVDSKLLFRQKPKPHFWLCVDGFHIDLTARQFNPFEQCPKVWKQENLDSSEYFYVVKGKGLVLFRLIPFNKRLFFENQIRIILRSSKNKIKSLITLVSRKGNGLFGNVYRGIIHSWVWRLWWIR